MPEERYNFTPEYKGGSETSPAPEPQSTFKEKEKDTDDSSATLPALSAVPTVKVEAKRYGFGKPQRKVIRARVTSDQG